jgi:splicing factor, arginine/serine-rich 12
VQVRIGFVKFADSTNVGVAQHMSNTVFIDRALIVTPYFGCKLHFRNKYLIKNSNYYILSAVIPDEPKGLEILNAGSNNGGLSEPKLPPSVTNQVEGVPPHQVIRTIDPRLSIHNLPPYPLLPASTDSRRLEEIRRTVVAINIDPAVSF